MIQLYENPLLLDYVKVCLQLPEDERKQIEAFSGCPYDIDSVAATHWQLPGYKFALKDGNEPICVGGFVPQRPGVYRDFMLNTPDAFGKHWLGVTRACRRVIDQLLAQESCHRIECITPVARSRVFRWYAKALGYNLEGTLYGYLANGTDAVIFSKVRH